MFFQLLLLFTLVPLAELAILIWIGSHTSIWFTLGLVLVTGVLGAALARWEGWRAIERLRSGLRGGAAPTDAMLDALLILVAGLVLITPGVLTDLFGFALLVPPIRNLIKRWLVTWFKKNVEIQSHRFTTSFHGFSDDDFDSDDPKIHSSRIIDVKVVEPGDMQSDQ